MASSQDENESLDRRFGQLLDEALRNPPEESTTRVELIAAREKLALCLEKGLSRRFLHAQFTRAGGSRELSALLRAAQGGVGDVAFVSAIRETVAASRAGGSKAKNGGSRLLDARRKMGKTLSEIRSETGQSRDLKCALLSFHDLELPAIPAQEIARQLSAFVARVGEDRANPWEQRTQATEQASSDAPVRDVCWLNPTSYWNAQRVNQNVALTSFDTLVRIKAGEHKKPGAALLDTPGWLGKTLGATIELQCRAHRCYAFTSSRWFCAASAR
jgi:hypothetical protein